MCYILNFLRTSLILLIINQVYAVNLPQHSAVPGGVAKINLNIAYRDNIKAFFNSQPILVTKDARTKKAVAIIGLPLEIKPGNYKVKYLTSDNSNQAKYKYFFIKDKKYKISRITIKNKNMVNPDSETQAKITADLAKIAKAVKTYSDNHPTSLVFQEPVIGFKTTSFGARRVINQQVKNPHTGMDIAAPMDTPVVAGGGGKVILAENFYIPGNIVAIDHGSGLITLYAHLNIILVAVGDTVEAGELIGRVGSTGRVTGPHLHWAVKLNQVSVDPALFLAHNNVS